jgi:precorrin-3B synthase
MHRRGACPTLEDPMPTGDGLLARWLPLTPLPLASFVALCQAAGREGNGIVEVTQRGSFQFRGLSDSTADAFLGAVEALGLAGNSSPPIWSSPLMGLEPEVSLDLRDWLSDLRAALAERYPANALNPKFSVLVDEGGRMHLDAVFADLRLVLGTSSRLHISLNGTAVAARALGWVALEHAAEAVFEVLDRAVAQGCGTRAKDLDIDDLRTRLGLAGGQDSRPGVERPSATRGSAEFLEPLALKDGSFARGLGLPFGFSEAAGLEALADIAARHGASAVRPAPERVLLFIGLGPDRLLDFASAAERAGFVISPTDPRRHVIACAGAPACRSALISTREMAPRVADAARGHIGDADVIHLSGCTKGCAHPRAAALAFVGPDRLIVGGRADAPAADHMTAAEFIGKVPALLRGELRP